MFSSAQASIQRAHPNSWAATLWQGMFKILGCLWRSKVGSKVFVGLDHFPAASPLPSRVLIYQAY